MGDKSGIDVADLSGYGDFMKGKIGSLDQVTQSTWTAKQTYIALGNLLTAAAELKIDACPMEGFDANVYNEILDLDKQNLNAAVVVATGYRSNEINTTRMKIIENLEWRYATKAFDDTKKIEEKDLEILTESIRLSPSSYGLQLFKVLVITDQETKEKLKPASWNQQQITQCSHLFVLCNYTKVEDKDIDTYLKLKADKSGIDVADLSGYGDFMKGKIGSLDQVTQSTWTAKQTYIALGNLLTAA